MTTPLPARELLGTRLRELLDHLDGAVAEVYADLGLADFRPRFTPVVMALGAGPLSIRDLAKAIGVTHSAASQTVAQMLKQDLVAATPGEDARQRIITLTAKTEALQPALAAEWSATSAAAAAFEAELAYPLSTLIEEALAVLRERPMRQRIAAELPA